MDKRGIIGIGAQSHIETILSFVIFAGFLFILLIFLNPVSQKSTNSAVLDFAERQIIDNLTISHEKISLILDAIPLKDCIYIENTIGAGDIVLVKDSQENIKKSKISSGKIYIETTSDERYYLIYYNSTLNSYPLTSLGDCDSTSYSFGLHDTDKLVLYENLVAFNKSYNTNYESLKTSLRLNNDFVFSVFNQSNAFIMGGERARPSALNILSRNIPLLAVDKNMSRKDILFNLRTW